MIRKPTLSQLTNDKRRKINQSVVLRNQALISWKKVYDLFKNKKATKEDLIHSLSVLNNIDGEILCYYNEERNEKEIDAIYDLTQ